MDLEMEVESLRQQKKPLEKDDKVLLEEKKNLILK